MSKLKSYCMKTRANLLVLLLTLIFPIMAKSQVKIQQTAGHDALGEFAPRICTSE